MRTVRISSKDGTITMLHDDEVNFEGLGKGITRLTDVQFDNATQKWVIKPLHAMLVNFGLGEFSFDDRKSALAFEEQFINGLIQKGEIR